MHINIIVCFCYYACVDRRAGEIKMSKTLLSNYSVLDNRFFLYLASHVINGISGPLAARAVVKFAAHSSYGLETGELFKHKSQ